MAQPEQINSFGADVYVPEVVAAGHICLDLIPSILAPDLQLLPGSLVETGAVVTSTGGSVSNTGLSLHKLGVRTCLIGKLGGDLFVGAVRDILETHGPGLSSHMVYAEDEQTSYSIILSPPGVDRMFLHCPGCNGTFDEQDIDYEVIRSARIFHFGYPPLLQRTIVDEGKSLSSIFKRAKLAGATTSLDMSLPDQNGPSGSVNWRALLARTLPFVDIFSPNIEEILLMMLPKLYFEKKSANRGGCLIDHIDANLVSSLGSELIDLGAKIVAIKIGHRGLYVRTAYPLMNAGRSAPKDIALWSGRELWSPCFVANVVGTTGSGDATIAGFLMALLRGMGPFASVDAACAVGASSVEAVDSVSGVRSWDETLRRMKHGWPRAPMTIDNFGWHKLDNQAIWAGPNDSGLN